MLHLRKIHNAVLLQLLLVLSTAAVSRAQTTTSTQANQPATAQPEGQQAVYLAGLSNVKPGADGKLFLSPGKVRFEGKNIHASIPVDQITYVARGDERAERGGTTGNVVRRLAVFHGANMALGLAMQTKVDLLSFAYHDEFGGLHGAVFVLPKDKASALEERLSAEINPHPLPSASPCSLDEVKPATIQLDPIEASGIEVPAEYRLLLYEHLLTHLRQQLPAYKFYRAGDIAAGPGCMAYSLHIALTGFKKGNDSLRASTGPIGMFAGVTSLSYQFALKNSSGVVVLDKTLKQSQRGDKESLNLTQSIAKKIAKLVDKDLHPQDSGKKSE